MPLSSKQLRLGLVLSTLFLCLPAFYNAVPLIFPDTTAYVFAGFTNTSLGPRIWTYGGFARHISLSETPWLVILLQSFFVAASIYLLFKYIFKTKEPWHFLFYILFISLTTAASFHASRLMPDIFTPLVLIHLGMLLFAPRMNRADQFLSGFLFFIALSMHNSHTILVVLMLAALGFGALFPVVRTFYKETFLTWKRMAGIGALMLACYFFVCSIHWSLGGGFRATQGGSIFLFARLIDFNIVQDYLEEHCDEMDAHICTHRHTIKWSANFLWGVEPSSLPQHGHWSDENKLFYQGLVQDILTTPKYLKRYIFRSLETTAAQLFYVDYDPISEKWHQWMFGATSKHYPQYRLAIEEGRQAKMDYRDADVGWMNHVQHLVFLLSILIVFWSLIYYDLPTSIRAITLLLILGLLVNAFIAAATSGVYDRYQSRVAWLITLPAFWIVCHYIENWKKGPAIETDVTTLMEE
ncbi:MAG: hypothetical protein ACRBFS_23040 [Aureispira sp.]